MKRVKRDDTYTNLVDVDKETTATETPTTTTTTTSLNEGIEVTVNNNNVTTTTTTTLPLPLPPPPSSSSSSTTIITTNNNNNNINNNNDDNYIYSSDITINKVITNFNRMIIEYLEINDIRHSCLSSKKFLHLNIYKKQAYMKIQQEMGKITCSRRRRQQKYLYDSDDSDGIYMYVDDSDDSNDNAQQHMIHRRYLKLLKAIILIRSKSKRSRRSIILPSHLYRLMVVYITNQLINGEIFLLRFVINGVFQLPLIRTDAIKECIRVSERDVFDYFVVSSKRQLKRYDKDCQLYDGITWLSMGNRMTYYEDKDEDIIIFIDYIRKILMNQMHSDKYIRKTIFFVIDRLSPDVDELIENLVEPIVVKTMTNSFEIWNIVCHMVEYVENDNWENDNDNDLLLKNFVVKAMMRMNNTNTNNTNNNKKGDRYMRKTLQFLEANLTYDDNDIGYRPLQENLIDIALNQMTDTCQIYRMMKDCIAYRIVGISNLVVSHVGEEVRFIESLVERTIIKMIQIHEDNNKNNDRCRALKDQIYMKLMMKFVKEKTPSYEFENQYLNNILCGEIDAYPIDKRQDRVISHERFTSLCMLVVRKMTNGVQIYRVMELLLEAKKYQGINIISQTELEAVAESALRRMGDSKPIVLTFTIKVLKYHISREKLKVLAEFVLNQIMQSKSRIEDNNNDDDNDDKYNGGLNYYYLMKCVTDRISSQEELESFVERVLETVTGDDNIAACIVFTITCLKEKLSEDKFSFFVKVAVAVSNKRMKKIEPIYSVIKCLADVKADVIPEDDLISFAERALKKITDDRRCVGVMMDRNYNYYYMTMKLLKKKISDDKFRSLVESLLKKLPPFPVRMTRFEIKLFELLRDKILEKSDENEWDENESNHNEYNEVEYMNFRDFDHDDGTDEGESDEGESDEHEHVDEFIDSDDLDDSNEDDEDEDDEDNEDNEDDEDNEDNEDNEEEDNEEEDNEDEDNEEFDNEDGNIYIRNWMERGR